MLVFIVCFFDILHKAEEVRLALINSEPELLSLENAVVAMRKPDGQLIWNIWNTFETGPDDATKVITNLMFNSLSADSTNLLADPAFECLSEVGITNEFLQKVICALKPGCSALFVAIERAKSDRLLERIQQMGHETLQTSLQYDRRKLDSSLQTKLAAMADNLQVKKT